MSRVLSVLLCITAGTALAQGLPSTPPTGSLGSGPASLNGDLTVNGDAGIKKNMMVTGDAGVEGNGYFMGSVGMGTRVPFQGLHLVDRNELFEGGGETSVQWKRDFTAGASINPIFALGRIVAGASVALPDGGTAALADFRIVYSDDTYPSPTYEYPILSLEASGTLATINNGIPESGYELYEFNGQPDPYGRLSSYSGVAAPNAGAELELGRLGGTALIGGMTRSGSTVTVNTFATNSFKTGDSVNMAYVGSNTDANYAAGAFTVTVTDTTHFTYTQAGTTAASLAQAFFSVGPDVAFRNGGGTAVLAVGPSGAQTTPFSCDGGGCLSPGTFLAGSNMNVAGTVDAGSIFTPGTLGATGAIRGGGAAFIAGTLDAGAIYTPASLGAGGNADIAGTLTATAQAASLKSVNCSGSPCQLLASTSGQSVQLEGKVNSGVGSGGAILIGNQNTLTATDTLVRFFNGAADVVDIFDDGAMLLAAGATRTKGSLTNSGGTNSVTVVSGCVPLCMDQTTPALLLTCSVFGTTLTETTTGASDVVKYICL